MLTPRQTSALSGDPSTSESEAKKQGLRLPNVPISLRNLRRPCSGRTAPVPHFYCFLSDHANHILRRTYRATNGTEKNGIGRLCGAESLVGKGNAVCVNRSLPNISFGRRQIQVRRRTPPSGCSLKLKEMSLDSFSITLRICVTRELIVHLFSYSNACVP